MSDVESHMGLRIEHGSIVSTRYPGMELPAVWTLREVTTHSLTHTHSIATNIAATLVILPIQIKTFCWIALCYYHNRRLLATATTIATKMFNKKCSNRIELIIWINRTTEKTGKSNFILNWFEYGYEIVKNTVCIDFSMECCYDRTSRFRFFIFHVLIVQLLPYIFWSLVQATLGRQ